MISGTGSLRSVSDTNSMEQHINQNNINNMNNLNNATIPNANQMSQDSSCTVVDDDCFQSVYNNDVYSV